MQAEPKGRLAAISMRALGVGSCQAAGIGAADRAAQRLKQGVILETNLQVERSRQRCKSRRHFDSLAEQSFGSGQSRDSCATTACSGVEAERQS